MKRLVALLAVCALLSPALLAKRRAVGSFGGAKMGDPIVGLSNAMRALFDAGKIEFEQRETVETGLGPVFNAAACSECHRLPVSGGGSDILVTRFGKLTNDRFDPLIPLGGPVQQVHGIAEFDGVEFEFRAEAIPSAATIVARRRSQPLFGLGLVDTTPDATFIALAAAQAARGDGTAGRANMVDNPAAGMQTVGKFGWKSQVPSLFHFSGEAYVNEMGITNPSFPDEICPSGKCEELTHNPQPGLNADAKAVQELTDFMMLLAPPGRGPITADARAGEAIFTQIGCDACHVPALQSGAHEIPALNRVTYHPYSDFLLHDMGSLGDGIEQGTATGTELRTAPLWGLRAITTFLHDGRATTIEAAIDGHDGQGAAARDRFKALSATDREKLLAFLKSL